MDETEAGYTHLPVFKRTLKAVVAVAVLAYGAGTWLAGSRLDDAATPSRIASQAGLADPVSTGSIGRDAASTRLDPCALPGRR